MEHKKVRPLLSVVFQIMSSEALEVPNVLSLIISHSHNQCAPPHMLSPK